MSFWGRSFFTITATAASLFASGGVEFIPNNAPWQFNNVDPHWSQENMSANLVNNTVSPQQVEGIRLTIPFAPRKMHNDDDPKISSSSVDDGNGPDRFELRITGEKKVGNQKCNRISPQSTYGLPIVATNLQKGKDFTPMHPQYLIKSGSFANDKFYENAKPFTLEELKNLTDNWAPFYDEDLYILDTLGAFGGPVSAGFIDTWYDQEGDSALFQVQIGIPDYPIKQNGITAKLNLGIMGEESGGAGPMYAMALIAQQELMNVDMQLLIASGTNEKQAALQRYTENNQTGQLTELGGSAFLTLQEDTQIGPFNFIKSSYDGYIFDCNRKFFPYDATKRSAYFYTSTPGMGNSIGGNSPQLVNATLMSSLYYWFLFEGFFNFKDVWVEDVFRRAADRRIAAKLALNAWRHGFTTDATYGADILYKQPQVITTQNVTTMLSETLYIEKMEKAMLPLLDANMRSVNNGGTCEIHDDSISLADLERFFFGMDGDGLVVDGATGTLGKGGLLWHYSVTEEDRIQLWSDMVEAFDYLKRRAPSTQNLTGDYVSLRYDFLGILRVARQYFNSDRPMPNGIEFTRFIDKHSTPDVVSDLSGKKIEGNYPFLVKGNQYFEQDNSFSIEISATDETYLDIDSAEVVEWTLDPNFIDWKPATKVSGDTLSAEYLATVPVEMITETYGEKGGIGWIRVSDRNLNSTVDTFYIEGVKHPRITAAEAHDKNGDGVADSLFVQLIKGQAEGAFELDSWNECRYAWPTPTPTKIANTSDVTTYSVTSTIAVIDELLTDGAGFGTIEFDYPEDKLVYSDLVDKVGPALIGAANFSNSDESRDYDTLVFDISEPLKLNFTAPFEYLSFSTDSNGTVNDIAGKFNEFKTDPTGVNATALLEKGVIAANSFLWVKLRSDGFTDTVSNNAALNSQWIKIDISGSETTFNSAAAFDTKGNGIYDRVTAALSEGSSTDHKTNADITEVIYKWSTTNELTVAQSDLTLTGTNEFSFNVSGADVQFGHGDGEITVKFAGSELPKNSIADSTGPAIETATLNIADDLRTVDVLELTISEEINNALQNGGGYLLFKDASDMSHTIASQSGVTDGSADKWDVTFTKDEISSMKEVMFVFNGGVQDLKQNPPLAINQWIPITIIGSATPQIVTAEMFDQNGDGDADSVVTTFELSTSTQTPETAHDNSRGEYSWPSDNNLVDAPTVTPVDNTTITMTGMSVDETAGDGKVRVTFPSGTVSKALADKVGPVITDALLWENVNGGDDILQVTFSEDVTGVLPNVATLYVDDTKKISPRAEQYNGMANTWLFTFAAADNAVAVDDSVNIVVNSGLEDYKGNEAHDQNVKVIVREKQRPIEIVTDESAYFDTNADGTMDRIQIVMAVPVDQNRISRFEAEFTWPTNASGMNMAETITIDSDKFSADGSDIITIDVSSFDIINGMTSIDPSFGELTLRQPNDDTPGQLDISDPFTPLDKMAPVLIETAMYRGKNLTSDETTFNDTLTVTYSEDVNQTNFASPETYLFGLIDQSNSDARYEITLVDESVNNGQTVSYVVQVTTNSSVIPAVGDSIRLTGNGMIRDDNGNVQEKETPYVPFKQVVLPAEYEVIIYPNPFTIDADTVNQLVELYGDGEDGRGKLAVVVRPYGNRVGSDLKGWISTFDAVGNVIDANEELTLTSKGVLLYTTDGKNSAGRAVGSGSYRSMITVQSGTGDDQQVNTIPVMIGVKKKNTVTE